jgi:molecular chaperone HscB
VNLQSISNCLACRALCAGPRALDARWKELQREAHPDRFAAQGAAAQRVAMQWSVRINEAYQRLKDPLKRAAYLCELHGAPIQAENNTAMPARFLMQQMEWREALDEAQQDEADLTPCRRGASSRKDALQKRCARNCWTSTTATPARAQQVRA